MTITRKKLIEVALPLDAINVASAREKSIRHGHPSTLHLWWARRPLAAARAVIFSQMVDDPSAVPEEFPTEEAQEAERQRLFRLIEQLVLWENTTNEGVLQRARDEIWRSWRRACVDNADHPQAAELFNPDKLPAFHDPFAGGGSLPLEAQRLGLEAYASDLNPVAVLINKAMIEIPPKFAGMPPVNPESRKGAGSTAAAWKGAAGLAEDVRYYGKWMRDEAEKRIGHLYPKVAVTPEMAVERPDLKPYEGRELVVIAWLWARTVKCPNPGCARAMPLLSSFVLSSKSGQTYYLHPEISGDRASFQIRSTAPSIGDPKQGYKRGVSGIFECAFCGTITSRNYVAEEAVTRGLGIMPTAVIAQGNRGRVYLPADASHPPQDIPSIDTIGLDVEFSPNPRETWCRNFGLLRPVDLFTQRQLVALSTLSDLVQEIRTHIKDDARRAALPDDGNALGKGGTGADGYSEAVSIYLSFAISKVANIGSTLASWMSDRGAFRETFARQVLPMVWDFAEANPFADTGGSLLTVIDKEALAIGTFPSYPTGVSVQQDAATKQEHAGIIVSTDPPYYDNIGYADLSDFFYVWLRRSLKGVYHDLFNTMVVPKAEELVALSYRHGSKQRAEDFFLNGMTKSMSHLADQAHPAFPTTIYYAVKQAETKGNDGIASTGWDIFLDAVIRAGFALTGTWPVRTEGAGRMIAWGNSVLASSIVLVCRRQSVDASSATRREFVAALRSELPLALTSMQHGNIAPVDLAQAAIGPGMAVFTRYSRVLDASGEQMKVREALALINQVLDEALAEQEGDFDADSRWALAWFEQVGFDEGQYGVAETLSKAKNTSVEGLVEAGVLASGRGTVRLLRPTELKVDWDPENDRRLTAWESVHQLVHALETGGEPAAAALAAKLGSHAETARELCYRLYTLCERKKRASEALSYNALVQSWPEIMRLAQETPRDQLQGTLL
ncbi:MAG: DUF1156 domain-containing protein [Chloroflexi bacterium]|nr:DUF1156 domain-containing protein [Chloroflexota bacterium]PWB43432.1 MAG: hypothetical protein C3F10_12180 [Dehalococcoidia bacterium]